MNKVIKRNGSFQNWNDDKIRTALSKAGCDDEKIVKAVKRKFKEVSLVDIEEIQDTIEKELMKRGYYDIAKNFIEYRYTKALKRSGEVESVISLIDGTNTAVQSENSNKNAMRLSTQRDLMAGEISKSVAREIIYSEDVIKAHDKGLIHIHDLDYRAQAMFNCCLVNLEDMLQNGTVLNGVKIDKPKSFRTACTVVTQILAQITSNQYGGATITLSHLAPFIQVSREKILNEVALESPSLGYTEIVEITEKRLRQEIKEGVQCLQYQTVTIMGGNGQSVFLSVVMDINDIEEQYKNDLAILIEEVLKQRIKGVKDKNGVWVSPAFPKLLYILDENNITEDSDYYYLTRLSAECTTKRMIPDYISAKISKQLKNGMVVYPMGCRSFLSVEKDILDDKGRPKLWGRFNQGVVTINLPYVACEAEGDEERFWELLEDDLELCHEAIKQGHKRLEGTVADVSPIHWMDGALARLESGETIDKLLHNNYSTISLGFAGLSECVWRIKGCSHTQEKDFALEVMKKLVAKCEQWKTEEGIAYGVYGSPIESTTGTFAEALKKQFGIIPHVSDKDYITNSYHVHVTEEIDWNDKLALESEFQKLSTAGAISYIEAPNMTNNLDAVLEIIKFMYDNILYAEINLKLDNCGLCGFEGEAELVEKEDGSLIFRCPECGNEDESSLSIVRRTTGYLGTQRWSHGRTAEIRDRVLHI